MNSIETPIDVEGIRKTYRDGIFRRRRIEALRGVTFQVGRGQIFGLLGPNGAGKTTLIKVLLGIVRRSGGRAALLGRPPGDRRGRQQVGYLPENHRIGRHHTGYTALEYYGSLSGLSTSETRRRRDPLLAAVGLKDWGKVSVRKYSKGMQQRLGLAQALLHDPALLVLDEPNDGVDPVGRTEMRALLENLKAQGKTIFINSHLLQEIELICDRVVILVRGEVRGEGRVEELTAGARTEATLTLAGSEPQVRSALAGCETSSISVEPSGLVRVNLAVVDQAALDRAIDQLRRAQLSVVELSRRRQTLEEAFIKIVNKEKRA